MRVLLTGVSSFTGCWFASALAEAGVEIVGTCRATVESYTGLSRRRLDMARSSGCRLVETGAFGDPRFLAVIASCGPFDLLCHHGAEVGDLRRADYDPLAALTSNTLNASAVMRAFAETGGKGLVVTGSVFEADEGGGGGPPVNAYGLAKTLTWQALRFHAACAGLATGRFVVPHPFGPLEKPGFTSGLVRSWLGGQPGIVRRPELVRDFVPVDLLAMAFAAFCRELLDHGGPARAAPSRPGKKADAPAEWRPRARGTLGPCRRPGRHGAVVRLRVGYTPRSAMRRGHPPGCVAFRRAGQARQYRPQHPARPCRCRAVVGPLRLLLYIWRFEFNLWLMIVDSSARLASGSGGVAPMVDNPAVSEIGVVVVTHAARHHLPHCLPPLLHSPLRPRVLVVNSSSDDGTVELACEMGAETLVVPRRHFNHGLTRELARRHLASRIVVMLTPDAYADDVDFLDRLTRPIRMDQAVVAYGRQLPREGAGLVERFGRAFNYPAEPQLRSLVDWPTYGSYTHFCSNACAAWLNAALDSIGGFRATLVSEETIAVAELLGRGGRIAYVADAVVRHSHDYRLVDELRRHFDVGWTRARFRELLLAREPDETRGRVFVAELVRTVLREQPGLLPGALASLVARLLGYRLGLVGDRLPLALARRLSGQDYFWSSSAFVDGAVA